MDSETIYTAVLERYSALSSDHSKLGGEYSKSVAQSFGYTEAELATIPAEANLGLSCGNPLAIVGLREGETVIDLGSGGGFDVFLAAKQVGPTGRAIGVDMNKDMLALAEKNKSKLKADNVEFVEAQITRIPLAGGIADAVISNCVVNLVPAEEKQLVFDEIARLLKPGGRVVISDILAKQVLPEKLQRCAAAYVGCVAGAGLVSEYQAYLERAGLTDVVIKDTNADLNVYIDTLPDGTRRAKDSEGGNHQAPTCCSPAAAKGAACCSREKKASGCCAPKTESDDDGCCSTSGEGGDKLDLPALAAELDGVDLNQFVGSYKIIARKPSVAL